MTSRLDPSENVAVEPVEFIATTDVAWFATEPLNVSVPMQEVMRVEVGSAQTTDVLSPDDVEYRVTGETVCQPCRLVRVFSQTSGTIRIHVTWTDGPSTLNLWVNGQMFPPTATREIVAEVPLTRGNGLIVYVGKTRGAAGNPITFARGVTGRIGVAARRRAFDVIVRQMMRWVKIEDVGDTESLIEEQVDRFRFIEENERSTWKKRLRVVGRLA